MAGPAATTAVRAREALRRAGVHDPARAAHEPRAPSEARDTGDRRHAVPTSDRTETSQGVVRDVERRNRGVDRLDADDRSRTRRAVERDHPGDQVSPERIAFGALDRKPHQRALPGRRTHGDRRVSRRRRHALAPVDQRADRGGERTHRRGRQPELSRFLHQHEAGAERPFIARYRPSRARATGSRGRTRTPA